ncbi:MAG TPA: T9SS type A sorting domain-containing protein, partial [Caldithrix abyssi]|nr:T9SS type A sorting domain-containing protein [Caldithrix abyssi]
FNVFRMYAMMPERGVRVTADSSLGAMASRNDSGLYLMVWNKDSQGQTADITLNNLPFKSDSVDIYTIDPDHASYFDNDSTAELELTETLALPDSGVPLSRALREYSVNLFVFRNSGVISSLAETRPIPRSLRLLSAYPNPFNPRTTLRLQLERRERLRISVWNVRGELLIKHPPAWFDAGESRVALDMNGYSGGVYFVEVRADAGWRQTVKVVLLR